MSLKRTSYEPLAAAWRPSMFWRNVNASSLCGHGCVGKDGIHTCHSKHVSTQKNAACHWRYLKPTCLQSSWLLLWIELNWIWFMLAPHVRTFHIYQRPFWLQLSLLEPKTRLGYLEHVLVTSCPGLLEVLKMNVVEDRTYISWPKTIQKPWFLFLGRFGFYLFPTPESVQGFFDQFALVFLWGW